MARERYYVGSTGPFFFDPTETRPDGTTQSALSIGGYTAGSERVDMVGTESSEADNTQGYIRAEVNGSTGRIKVGADEDKDVGVVKVSGDTNTSGAGVYIVDTSSQEVTLTINSNDEVEGYLFYFKRSGKHKLTIDLQSGNTIEGENKVILPEDKMALTMVFDSNNSDWKIL